MEQDYRIEALVGTFTDHAKMTEQHTEQLVNAFIENNPGQEIPPYMKDTFNISKALAAMCEEIERLKIRCN